MTLKWRDCYEYKPNNDLFVMIPYTSIFYSFYHPSGCVLATNMPQFDIYDNVTNIPGGIQRQL